MLKTNRLLAIALFLPFAACQKGSGPTTAPDTTGAGADTAGGSDTGGTDTEPGAPSIKWQDKTFKQRQEFMGVFFLKEMKEGFKGYNESQYASFKCQSCHGDDMKERNWAMPSDSIYPLNADDPIKEAMDYDPEITKFMQDWVVPKGAELLDHEVGDPKAPTEGTFGCFSCHPKEE